MVPSSAIQEVLGALLWETYRFAITSSGLSAQAAGWHLSAEIAFAAAGVSNLRES